MLGADQITYGISEYKLIGAILHNGSTTLSGHYVAYTRTEEGNFMKYDDLGGSRNRLVVPSYVPANEEFEKAKEDAYILFYEIVADVDRSVQTEEVIDEIIDFIIDIVV